LASLRERWRIGCIALLAMPGLLLAQANPASNVPAPAGQAAAFDQALQRVIGPDSLSATNTAYDADLERLRSLLPAGDQARDARLRSVYCGSSTWRNPVEALVYSDAALALARDLHDTASEARAMLCRAEYVMLTSGSQRGLPEVSKAIDLLANGREPQLLAESLETRGDILSLLGEQAKAMLDFQRARAAYRQADIPGEVESLVLSIAVAYRRMGDAEQARRYFTQALQRMQARSDWEGAATNLIQLGFLEEEAGAPERALGPFQQALDIATKRQLPDTANSALLGLAEAQIGLGQGDAALRTLDRARQGFAAREDGSSEDSLQLLTGQALARQGRHADALKHYRQALPLIKRNGNDRYLALLYKAQAASLEALGHDGAALSDYKQYTELQLRLQGKMRLEQGRLLEYEYEIRRGEFENRRLRIEAATKQDQVHALERVRRWQWLTIALGALLLAMLALLAWRHRRTSRRLSRQSLIDPLTGVANRAAIEAEAIRAIERAPRAGSTVSLLMLDLDHFKSINDRHGHAAGDRVLCATTDAWQALLRGRDPLGRIGGEEFVVVCADTTLEQAVVVAERLREATAALRFDDINPELRVTVSIGVAQSQRIGDTHEGVLARADAALYRAKQRGRGRVEH
jgi:diguanylate cyclase (GGDEF)-like protein